MVGVTEALAVGSTAKSSSPALSHTTQHSYQNTARSDFKARPAGIPNVPCSPAVEVVGVMMTPITLTSQTATAAVEL